MQRKVKWIAALPTDEIKAHFGDPKYKIFFGAAAKSVQERGEDLRFAFPVFLVMTLSGNMSLVILGKKCLKTYFSDVVKEIDLGKTLLSQESKARLQELKQKVDELTKTFTVRRTAARDVSRYPQKRIILLHAHVLYCILCVDN